MSSFRSVASRFGMALILLLLVVYFSTMSEAFLTQQNLTNILRQVAMLGIAAVGMTLVILTGGIDLSVGSTLALTGVVAALGMTYLDIGIIPSIVLGLLTGVAVGLVNGLAVTALRIPPLIATLAMLTAARGVCFILTGGLPIFGFPSGFAVIGRGMVGIVPVPVIIMVVMMAIGWILLNHTKYGRYLYAIGGNQEAARLSGVPVGRYLIISYVIAGFFSAVAGIILLSRLNTGQPNTATGFEMDVITAVVLGGISIAGGEGRFTGVIFGVLLIGVLSNGMTLLNVQEYYQLVIKGAVLFFAVALDQYNLRMNEVSRGRVVHETESKAAVLKPMPGE
ncbi:ABC transporter permease [Shinella daejeonensis]|uniref:ABC transporter permease n=1 Tax=Shinella daejeonensis TaxID=659017 RepID=UPI0020C7CE27|nr:ABC transporter permease [Shinella daejeonensis]MCP8894575.1 ABC transporter permease [Shinella daejeonensis]